LGCGGGIIVKKKKNSLTKKSNFVGVRDGDGARAGKPRCQVKKKKKKTKKKVCPLI